MFSLKIMNAKLRLLLIKGMCLHQVVRQYVSPLKSPNFDAVNIKWLTVFSMATYFLEIWSPIFMILF